MDFPQPKPMLLLEFSDIGCAAPFKVIKVEPDDEDIFPIQPAVTVKEEPVTVPDPPLAHANCTCPPPNKRIKTEPDTDDVMEIMNSDDEVVSIDSDMSREYDSSDSESSDDSGEDEPPRTRASCGTCGGARGPQPEPELIWTFDRSSMTSYPFTKNKQLLVPPPENPYEAFRWILTDDLLDMIVSETNKYATHISNKSALKTWKTLTRGELITFLGLLIHTGTIRMDKITDYWKLDHLFNLTCFNNFMHRNRFLAILKCLTFSSEVESNDSRQRESGDRKILPIVNHFNKRMSEIYYPDRELLVAKTTITSENRLMRHEKAGGNDTRHAASRHKTPMNVFMLAEPGGVVVKYLVRCAKPPDNFAKDATRAIIKELLEGYLDNGHAVFLEKSYNSYKLAHDLLQCKTYCTGILSKRSKENPFRLPQPYRLSKYANRSYYCDGVHIGKWKKKKEILYISTQFANEAITDDVRRRPSALKYYKRYMRSSALRRQLRACHAYSGSTFRVHRRLFIHTLQMYMSNAYHLFRAFTSVTGDRRRIPYYEFRLCVLREMLPDTSKPPPLPKVLESNAPDAVHGMTKVTKTKSQERSFRDGSVKLVTAPVRRDCRNCRRRGKRTTTLYECLACRGSPGYCPSCFFEAHAHLDAACLATPLTNTPELDVT